MKWRAPESTSQLIANQGKAGANGRPKWEQICTFSNLIQKKNEFYSNGFFGGQKFFKKIKHD